jgi:RHS repeat-associated protein
MAMSRASLGRAMRMVPLLLGLLAAAPASAASRIYYVHNDQLGTPQVMTDESGNVVWQADYEPFGRASETTALVVQPLRFPGQYRNAETGLHYNYFRDYDPQTGRYIESDPIGLPGGLNTYIYAYGNPSRYIDLNGTFGIAGFLICGGISLASHLGDIRDISNALKAANEAFQEIEKLKAEKNHCKDNIKRNLEIDAQIKNLRQQRSAGITRSAATGFPITVGAVFAGLICGALSPI